MIILCCLHIYIGTFGRERIKKEGNRMVNYNKLWHKLVDLKMNKSQLRISSGISSSTLAKLGKNEIVSLEVLEKICETLDCSIEDVVTVSKRSE